MGSQNFLGHVRSFIADIIFQYSFDSSVSVWYLMLLYVFLSFAYLTLNTVSLMTINFFFEFSSFGAILALCKTLLVRHFSLSGHWCFLMQLHVHVILSFGGLIIFLLCALMFFMLFMQL